MQDFVLCLSINLYGRAEEYGPLFRIFVLHKCLVVPTSRTAIKVLVTHDFLCFTVTADIQ